jgi:DNA-binding transcriptional regulator YiaG
VKQLHEAYIALGDAFAREAGIDPQAFHDACAGIPSDKRLVDGLVSAFYPRVPPSSFVIEGLPTDTDAVTIDTPMQTQSTHDIRGARPTKSKATEALRALGVSIAEVAKELEVPYSTARSWFQKGDAGRAVPARHAAALLKKYGIKASDLPNGVVGK